MDNPKILIVDDDRVQLNVLTELLKTDYQVLTATSGMDALQALDNHHLPDLILLDVIMPDMDGFSVCKKLRSNDRTHHIPVIFLTIEQQARYEARGFEAGAVDFIKKPINPKLIRARISTHLRLKNVYTQQALLNSVNHRLESNEALDSLENLDPVSGLPNRYYIKDRWSQVLNTAREQQHQAALLVINLDLFSHINAALGHELGDRLLRRVALMLNFHVRGKHIVSRLDSDEFVIILQHVNGIDPAVTLSEQLVQLFKRPIFLEQHEIFLGASIGMARFPEEGEDVDTLLNHATIAMRHAKANGRGTYQCYQTISNEKPGKRSQIEKALHNALNANQFCLQLQPIIDLRTQKTMGAEALVRWQGIGQNTIAPADFIPIAQEAGLMTSIDDWVLQTACTIAQRGLLKQHPDFRLSVNISRQQLSQVDMIDRWLDIFSDTGFPTHSLTVEINESDLMNPTQTLIEHLQFLKSIDIRLSIDDFGSTDSTSSYIQQVPIDEIKIDCALLKTTENSKGSDCLSNDLIKAAQQYNTRVIIKGIETAQQYQLLHNHAPLCAQGFFFGQPIPANEFEQYLQQSGTYALM